MPRRTPQDVWNQLAAEAGEDATERAASVSLAQAEAELREAGFDVKAERAKGAALVEELSGSPAGYPTREADADEPAAEPTAWVSVPPPPEAVVRPLYRRYAVLLAAVLVAATVGGAVALGLFNKDKPNPPIDNRPDAAPPSTALPAPTAPPQGSYRRVDPTNDKPKLHTP